MSDPVADELAVRALVAEYTDAINRKAVAEATRTYADDSSFTMMDRPTVERYEMIVHSGIVQVDGDRARARWQITELQFRTDGSRRYVIGRYEDELARLADGWRFSARRFTTRYLGDVSLADDVLPDAPVRFDL